MNKKIVVIGGGAAGMMAAVSAAEQGAQVTLLEPNERLGKKLNITGKGRCNVTNNTDIEGLLANIPRNGKFLYSAFNRFNSADAMAFFEKLGVPLKIERGNRVFPVSDSAFDISAALERRLKALTQTNDGFRIAEEDLKLRGPGDFFGSRQHGLPTLKAADLSCDMPLLAEARDAAQQLLAGDPLLTRPEHAVLRHRVQALFRQKDGTLN